MPSLPTRSYSKPSFSFPRFGRRNDEFEEFENSNEDLQTIYSDTVNDVDYSDSAEMFEEEE